MADIETEDIKTSADLSSQSVSLWGRSMSGPSTEVEGSKMEKASHHLCTSAKQYRKMSKEKEPDVGMKYTWEQTNSDVAMTLSFSGLHNEQTKKFDITFTSTEVHINMSEDKKITIQLYSTIEKEKSRVRWENGQIKLFVLKQQAGLWPELEAVLPSQCVSDLLTEPPNHIGNGDMGPASDYVIGHAGQVGRENTDTGMSDTHKCEEDGGTENRDKEEEPVYMLDHLKHDFFERDLVLTLQVYIKSLDKDAVKIVFTTQGFVLKFHTGDGRFLQLHDRTSVETTFSWPVTTRKEIVPEQCKFKVKQSVIEISLRKTSTVRWTSLEAPIRKEITGKSSDNSLPISNLSPYPSSNASYVTPTSSLPSASVIAVDTPPPQTDKDVAFEELGDVDLKREKIGKRSLDAFSLKFGSNADKPVDHPESITSILGDNIRFKPATQDWNVAIKPTAKVHPLNKEVSTPSLVIPTGFAGLVNLGNTCFMNCVLQVLANTREFRNYFFDDSFRHEINEDNPLGMRGQLAATFGILMKRLWSRTRHCWEPRKLKDLISKKNPQFFGYAQHDAHEFLAFLLDGLHEDLNRIRIKPYTETIDSNGRPDEVVANEAWAQHKQRNDSVVVDLFQGQYKSKLVCPRCCKVSITFDPFLYLSVPLPKKKKVITVTFMWKESYKKPLRYQIVLAQDSTVDKLQEELSQRTKVRVCDIRVFETHRGRIHKYFLNGASLSNAEPKDIIIASEVLSEELAGEEVLEIPVMQRTLFPSEYPSCCAFCHKGCIEGHPLRRCTKCYKVRYCDQMCQRNHWNLHKSQCSTCPEPIGCPFILSLPASRATYNYLVKHMEGFARFSVDVFQPPVKTTDTVSKAGGPSKANGPNHTSNLTSSLSQSCSSLNSLDSLSSTSSTCTLTGDQSDPQTQFDGAEDTNEINDPDRFVSSSMSSSSLHTSPSPPCSVHQDGGRASDLNDNSRQMGSDTGSKTTTKGTEKCVPMSQVIGVQAAEVERDRAPITFFIKPVTVDRVGIKEADKLVDKGETPLELDNRHMLSMDWRNNEKLHSYVLVQSKELEADEMDNLNNMTSASGSKPTLYQCLELFTEPEVLNPEEAWYCPSCKKHVEASKQMSIWKLPHTLIIQLKRFSFQNFLMRSKIKKHVEFPTRGLDLSKFCVGLQPNDPPPVYDLYGVANHHGLLIGGHYTAFAKCYGDTASTDWRLCDDSRVSYVASEQSVVTPDAYLLFYRHRGSPATINIGAPVSAGEERMDLIQPPTSHIAADNDTNGNTMETGEEVSSISDDKEVVNIRLLRESSKGPVVHSTGQTVIKPTLSVESEAVQDKKNLRQNEELVHDNQQKEWKVEREQDDWLEKRDKEKGELADLGHGHSNTTNSDDEKDDSDRGEKELIIDTSHELDYTDMEAVD